MAANCRKRELLRVRKISHFAWHSIIDCLGHVVVQAIRVTVNIFQSHAAISMLLSAVEIRFVSIHGKIVRSNQFSSFQMYCVPVKAGDRGRLSEEEIASQLLYILSDAPCLPQKPHPIGILTAEPRSAWAHDRENLLEDEQNARNIELIEQALVLICLDESLPASFNARGFHGANESVHLSGARVSHERKVVKMMEIFLISRKFFFRMKRTWPTK